MVPTGCILGLVRRVNGSLSPFYWPLLVVHDVRTAEGETAWTFACFTLLGTFLYLRSALYPPFGGFWPEREHVKLVPWKQPVSINPKCESKLVFPTHILYRWPILAFFVFLRENDNLFAFLQLLDNLTLQFPEVQTCSAEKQRDALWYNIPPVKHIYRDGSSPIESGASYVIVSSLSVHQVVATSLVLSMLYFHKNSLNFLLFWLVVLVVWFCYQCFT